MACTDSDCFLPDGGLPGMKLPRPSTERSFYKTVLGRVEGGR